MRPKEFEPDEIADAAMQVFWQRGYAGTSIQDLVQGTGLSRSSLYSTFESKQGLYERALQRYSAVTTANVELISGPGSAKDLIERLLKRVAESELKDPLQRGCLMTNASLELAAHDKTVAGLVGRNFQRIQQALEVLIERGISSGELTSKLAPGALALFFVNTMQGMRVLGKGYPIAQRRQCLNDVIAVALSTL